ncbi:MAG: hypothetical protein RJA99_132 [Pseudomonadota bacterium]
MRRGTPLIRIGYGSRVHDGGQTNGSTTPSEARRAVTDGIRGETPAGGGNVAFARLRATTAGRFVLSAGTGARHASTHRKRFDRVTTVLPAFVLSLLHFAALAGLGALVRSRLLVLLVAVVGTGWLALVTHPADLASQSVQDLVTTFGGVVLGAATGLWAAGARQRRAREERVARDVAAGLPPSAPERRGRAGVIGWAGGALLVALAAAVGLYLEGSTVPAWRATVDGWRETPAARSLGLAPAPAAAATGAAPKGGAAATSTGARAGPSDRSGANGAGPAARPQGDMRHCLERGATQDVLRCAEQRR